MIHVNNVCYSYGISKPYVLEDFSLHITDPGVYGLLGPNGSGKSTLLGLICGMLIPDKGQVLIGGFEAKKRLPGVLANIVYVPEEFILPVVSLDKFIKDRGSLYPYFSADKMFACLEEFNMEKNIRNISQLSMGQRKKVMISFALACNTPLLVMDEPTNGLDIQSKITFRRLIATMTHDEAAVIISTHQVRDLDTLLDHIIIMNNRHVLLDATVNDIMLRFDFRHALSPDQATGALYSIFNTSGTDAMFVGDGSGQTDVDLELLFGAAIEKPQIFSL